MKNTELKKVVKIYFNKIHARYPKVKLKSIYKRSRDDVWVDLVIPIDLEDDDDYKDLISTCGVDILDNYDCYVGFHSLSKKNEKR